MWLRWCLIKKKLMKGDKNDGPHFLNVFDVVLRVLKKIED